jgi:hypothetical protein
VQATEFFSTVCKAEPMFGCPLDKQRQYIETTLKLKEYVASAGVAMVFEESPSYGEPMVKHASACIGLKSNSHKHDNVQQ